MPRFTKESLETLRSRIVLAEVLSPHIDLKRQGSSFKALCPFHAEKSPSFVVNRGDSHYHCFGCGAHGDAIQFLMQHLRLSFSDAVQQLAERFQVPLEQIEGTGQEQKRSSKARLKEALDQASRFFQTCLLHTQEGRGALHYLFKRGISLDFIHTFRVGLSLRLEGPFRKFMHSCHYSEEELQEAGLVVERGGKRREFFQERLMFPILDVTGQTIGFSARKYQESTFGGKYINTSETPLFKKSKVLFGLSTSRRRIIKQKQAIIVEGGLDALGMIYNGFDLTVAALGTAFGEGHVHELCQLGVSRLFLLFDGDTAGQEAAVKVGHLFQKRGVEVLVATLPAGADPDSLLSREGPLAISRALVQAKEYLAFLVDHHKNVPKNQMIQEIVQRIREWDDQVMVHESLKKLSSLTELPQEILAGGAIQPRTIFFKSRASSLQNVNVDPERILEADFLRWLILCGPGDESLAKLCITNMQPEELRFALAAKIYSQVLSCLIEKKELNLLELSAAVDDDGMESFLSEILNKKINRDKVREQLIETMQRIKERNWMHERESVKMKIHSGSSSEEELMQLVKQFDELKKSMPKVLL